MRRPVLLALLVSGLALSACSNNCQDLGDRLCACVGSGTLRDTCKREVQNQISASANASTQATCGAYLDTCNAPPGASFCAWIQTACGKASCGMSNEPIDATTCPPP